MSIKISNITYKISYIINKIPDMQYEISYSYKISYIIYKISDMHILFISGILYNI